MAKPALLALLALLAFIALLSRISKTLFINSPSKMSAIL
jgi:hypothetical protein